MQSRALDEKYSTLPRSDADRHLGFKLHCRATCLLGDNHKYSEVSPPNQPDKPKKDRRTISVTECECSSIFFSSL